MNTSVYFANDRKIFFLENLVPPPDPEMELNQSSIFLGNVIPNPTLFFLIDSGQGAVGSFLLMLGIPASSSWL